MKVRAKNTGVALLTVAATLLNAAAVMGDDAEKGKTLYAGRCAFCHGLAGKGDGPAGSAL